VRPKARWILTDGLPIAIGLSAVTAALVTAVTILHVPQRAVHWWSCNGGSEGAPTWSPDGRKVAFAREGDCDVEVIVVNADGSGARVLAHAFAEWPDWSPDGREVLVETHDGLAVEPTGGGPPRLVHRGSSDEGGAWSPDGSLIAFTHGFLASAGGDYQSTLYVVGRDGTGLRRVVGHSCDPGTPDWSPDGSLLAVGCADGVYIFDLRTGAYRRVFKVEFGFDPPKPSWSPDGRSLAYIDSDEGGLYVVPAIGAAQVRRLVSVESGGWSDAAAWSPDGRWLAYSQSRDGSSDGIYIVGSDGRNDRRIARY
jgi:Tol biopolymer transport system component